MDDNTAQLQLWIDRIRAGDESARDEIINRSCNRLRRLAHRMLDGFPNARARLDETDDVLVEGAMRLRRALESVPIDSVRGYLGLAAKKMREYLLDMTRRLPPPIAMGGSSEDPDGLCLNPEAKTIGPATRAEWKEFHEAIDRLPKKDREMFDMLVYNKLPQAEAAQLLGVSVRTVKRRWQDARIALHDKQPEMPGK